MENKELMQLFSSLLEEKLQPLDEHFKGLEDGQQQIIKKIDNVSKQVATNTEMQASIENMAIKIAEHDTDIRLIKKFVAN